MVTSGERSNELLWFTYASVFR